MDNQADKEVLLMQTIWNEHVKALKSKDFQRVYLDVVREDATPPNLVTYKVRISADVRSKLNSASYYPLSFRERAGEPRVLLYSPEHVYVPFGHEGEDVFFKIRCVVDAACTSEKLPQIYITPSKSFVKFCT